MGDAPDRSAAITRGWLSKAADDLAIASLVLNSEVGVEWAACFHAQQAAEKAVKAVLVHLGLDFPKSHRLDLLARLVPASSSVGFESAALTELAPWAVAGRYPEDIENPTAADAAHLIEIAQNVVQRASDFIAAERAT